MKHDPLIRPLISVEQAAEMLGVSHFTIRRRIADGTIRGAVKLGHVVRLNPDDVLAALVPIQPDTSDQDGVCR